MSSPNLDPAVDAVIRNAVAAMRRARLIQLAPDGRVMVKYPADCVERVESLLWVVTASIASDARDVIGTAAVYPVQALRVSYDATGRPVAEAIFRFSPVGEKIRGVERSIVHPLYIDRIESLAPADTRRI